MNPLSYLDVQREHEEFLKLNPNRPLALTDYAKARDQLEGTNLRASAYEDGMFKKANAFIDRTIEATGAPDAAAGAGRLIGDTIGASPEVTNVLESVGQSLPRMAGEAALTAIPVAGQAGRAAQIAAKLGQVVGYSSAFTRGTAEHDSMLGGAVEVATLGLGNKYLPKVDDAAVAFVNQKLYGKLSGELTDAAAQGAGELTKVLEKGTVADAIAAKGARAAAQIGAGGVAGAALGEVNRQAQLTVDGAPFADRNPFTMENIVGNVAGALAFAPIQIANQFKGAAGVDLGRYEAVKGWADKTLEVKPPKAALESALDTYLGDKTPESLNNAIRAGDATLDIQEALFAGNRQLLSKANILYEAAKAQGVVPSDLGSLVKSVNDLIDERNMTITAEAPKRKGFLYKEGFDDPREVDAKVEVKGPSSAAVNQLQDKGYLPKITEGWVKETFQKHFERSLDQNPEFAYRGLVNEITNHLLTISEEAQGRMRQDVAKQPSVRAEFDVAAKTVETDYMTSLASLRQLQQAGTVPLELFQSVLDKHFDYSQTKGGRYGEETGRSKYGAWMEQVVDAVNNYDPATGMTEINVGKDNKVKAMTLEDAFNHKPKERRLTKALGGGSTKETSDLGFDETSQTKSDIAAAQVYEDMVKGTGTFTEDGVKRGETGDAVPVEDNLPADAVVTPSNSPQAEVANQLREKLQTTDSGTLFKAVEPWMRGPGKSETVVQGQKAQMREALGALIELRGDRKYLSADTIAFAKKNNQAFDRLVQARGAENGAREATRIAVMNFWDGTVEKMWKTLRPGEPVPTGKDTIKKYEVLLERVLGKDEIARLKAQGDVMRDGLQPNQSLGVATDRVTTNTVQDASRAFNQFFRGQGYEQPLADHFTGIATRTMMAYNDIRFKFAKLSPDDPRTTKVQGTDKVLALVNQTLNDLKIAGVYSSQFISTNGIENQSVIALALDHSKGSKDPVISAFTLSVLAHELIHGVENASQGGYQVLDGPYSEQRVQNYRKMTAVANSLTPKDRAAMLENLVDVVFPKSLLRTNPDGSMREDLAGFVALASQKPNEFISTYGQLLALGKMTQDSANPTNYTRQVRDWLRWQNDDVQAFTRGFYRDLSDQSGALAEMIRRPEYRWAEGLNDLSLDQSPEYVARQLESFHKAANDMLAVEDFNTVKRQAAELVATLQNPFDGPPVARAKLGVWTKLDENRSSFGGIEFMARAEVLDKTAVEAAATSFWGDKTGHEIGKFSYLMPFFQLLDSLQKRGLTMAGDVWTTLSDVQPSMNRAMTRMLEPVLLRKDGKMTFNDDHPLLQIASASQKSPKALIARNVINDIAQWQNNNNSISAVERLPDGRLTWSREAAPYANKMMAKVPVGWHQAVIAGIDGLNQVGRQASNVLFEGQVSKAAYRLASLEMHTNSTMPYEIAMKNGDYLVRTALTALSDKSNLTVPAFSKFLALTKGVEPATLDLASRYLFSAVERGEDGLTDSSPAIGKNLMALREHLDSRPGFTSEQRPGRFLIESVNKDGKKEVDGAESAAHRKAVETRLKAQGNKIVQVIDKTDLARMTNYDAPDMVYEKAAKAEVENWNNFLERAGKVLLRPDQIEALRDNYAPGEVLAKEVATRGMGKFTAKRNFVGGRERLDYFDTTRGYVQSLAGSVSRQEARNKMRLMMNDVRLEKEVDFKARALQQMDWVMTPDSELSSKIKSGMSAYYLGGNLSSMMIEGAQSAVTLVPQLLEQGGKGYGLGSAWKTVGNAAFEAWKLGSSESYSDYVAAGHKLKTGAKLSATEERTYWFRRALDEGILDHGAIQDVYDRDQRALLARKFGHGDYGDTTISGMVGNKVYQASQMLLFAYGKMSNFNQKIAFTAGLKQGQELGLSGDALYHHARKTKDLSMFGGGKANQPGALALVSNPHTKSTFGVMYTLQQYGLGMTAHLVERARNSFDTSRALTPEQRTQSRKAFTTMAATQMALAGALGLPFVGATLTMMEKLFGINANAAVREGLASLGGEDQEMGSLISELALDGSASHFLGIDVGSRVGVSSLLGTSAYRGFSVQDLLGPAPSLIGNMVNGVNAAATGNKWEAAKQLVPAAFKNLVSQGASNAQYGDLAFRDKSSNLLYSPTSREAALYAIGFRPRELAQKQKMQTLLRTSEDLFAKSNDSMMDELARSVRSGDATKLTRHIQQTSAANPQFDGKSFAASVVNRAVNMDSTVDPLAMGATGNQSVRQQIAQSFGSDVLDRRSETERALRADELNAVTGYQAGKPLTGRELMKASMVDSFTKTGLTRSQALQKLELMGL